MARLILALGVGALTGAASFVLMSAIHRRVGDLFGPGSWRGRGASSEGGGAAKPGRLASRNARASTWATRFYAVVLGLLAGVAVWRAL